MRPFPFVLARSPPPAHRRFHRRLPCGTLCGYSRAAKPLAGGSPCPRGPGGSRVRALVRAGSRLHPAHLPLDGLSPYEVPELGVLQPGDGPCGLQAACSGQRGDRTLPVSGLAIVRPRLWLPGSAGPPVSLGPLVPHDTLSTGHPCTRRGAMGSLPAGSRTRTDFPRPSPRGWSPGTLSASPNLPLVPQGCGSAVEPRAVPRTRCVECRASQDVPPARGFPGVPSPPAATGEKVLVRPRHHPG